MVEFRNVFESNGLNVVSYLPTHYFNTGASLLDLLVSRKTASIVRIDQLDTGILGCQITMF